MSRLGTRKSPSGPKVSLQLPFYLSQPTTATTNFVALSTVSNDPTEALCQYRIPVPGKLDTLLVNNNPVGANAVNVTYQVRKNGADVGDPVVIANNAAGPVKAQLDDVAVLAGDLISIECAAGAFGGAAPMSRIELTWTPNGSV